MNTINNNNCENVPAFRARVQLESLRMPVQILQGDSLKDCQPVQLSHFASEFSNQAFRDLANGPDMNLEELDNSVNFYDSDAEILLSDSDEEEIMENCESDVDTNVGSDFEGELSESNDCAEDVFDEPMNNSLPAQRSNKVKNSFTVSRRVFLEDCDTAKKQ